MLDSPGLLGAKGHHHEKARERAGSWRSATVSIATGCTCVFPVNEEKYQLARTGTETSDSRVRAPERSYSGARVIMLYHQVGRFSKRCALYYRGQEKNRVE